MSDREKIAEALELIEGHLPFGKDNPAYPRIATLLTAQSEDVGEPTREQTLDELAARLPHLPAYQAMDKLRHWGIMHRGRHPTKEAEK